MAGLGRIMFICGVGGESGQSARERRPPTHPLVPARFGTTVVFY